MLMALAALAAVAVASHGRKPVGSMKAISSSWKYRRPCPRKRGINQL
jgi:hypothetical protein